MIVIIIFFGIFLYVVIATFIRLRKDKVIAVLYEKSIAFFAAVLFLTGVNAFLLVNEIQAVNELKALLADGETRGIEAYIEYRKIDPEYINPDKNLALEKHTTHYTNELNDKIQLLKDTAGSFALLCIMIIIVNLSYLHIFTKSGLCYYSIYEPEKFTVKSDGKRILIFIGDRKEPTFKLKPTEKNIARFGNGEDDNINL